MIRTTILTGVLVLLAGCGGGKPEARSKAGEPSGAAVPVYMTTVQAEEWPSIYDATGTVRSRMSGQVSSRLMAYVREVRVHAGERVRQGQVLVILDGRELEVRQRQAEAGRVEARSAAVEADQGIESARAQLELTEVTFKRMKELYDKRSISNQEFDEASARLRTSRAAVDMAQARRKQVESRIASSSEEIRGAEIQAGYSTVVAPFAGVVTERNVEPGNLAVPGAPLLTVEREGGFRLEAAVEEANLAKVRLGQRVEVSIDSLPSPISGTVSEIVPAIDPVSRSFIAKVDLPGAANLRSGLFGHAKFVTGVRRVIAVPVVAVAEHGQMLWVFTAEDGRARARIVTLGARNGSRVEVLSGLAKSERIIASVPAELTDGARVEARP